MVVSPSLQPDAAQVVASCYVAYEFHSDGISDWTALNGALVNSLSKPKLKNRYLIANWCNLFAYKMMTDLKLQE